MRKNNVIFAAAMAVALVAGASLAAAKGRDARATCLARAGVTEQQWQGRNATYAQGAIFKKCMAEHGQDVTVRRRDGSVLY